MKYTSVDRVLAKLHRDLNIEEISESDLIEWIAEALEGIQGDNYAMGTNEEAVAFIEVKNHQADIPLGTKAIIQIARNNEWTPSNKCITLPEVTEECNQECVPQYDPCDDTCHPVVLDCKGTPITDYELAYYRPYFDLQYEYYGWCNSNYYRRGYTPVRLANHTFFNSIVCRETNEDIKQLYHNHTDEYTIVESANTLRFSFQEGHVAVAYVRQALDPETGYPLIPDKYAYMQAIVFYVKLKLAQRYEWMGRQGYSQLANKAEADWHWYCKQATNEDLIPKGVDELQDIYDQRNYLLPHNNRYYGFFGKLAQPEVRTYNDPDGRNVGFRNRNFR